jgi:hypothetical protein
VLTEERYIESGGRKGMRESEDERVVQSECKKEAEKNDV